MSINTIKPCGTLSHKWNWKSGDYYIDNTIGGGSIPMLRNYFDCGIYFFDGTFNVVKFPKGMNIYHGSLPLSNAVVGFPVGMSYYESDRLSGNYINTPQLETVVVASSEESIEELISDHIPITAGWYGDINIAKNYSKNNKERSPICGDKCVFAYKLKKDIILLLLDDDYNISKIFETNSLPEELKKSLEFMFSLQGKRNSYVVSKDKVNSVIYPYKKRLSEFENDKNFSNLACKHIIDVLKYSGYCANNQTANKSIDFHIRNGSGFHLEFIFCNAFKWLERDLLNPNDWQNQTFINNSPEVDPLIKIYYQQLDLYETTNFNFHSGNLLEHSVWSLLWAEFILDKSGEFNKLLIPDYIIKNVDNIKRVIAFSAFIHDIGKMAFSKDPSIIYNNIRKKFIYNDVKENMIYGAEYIENNFFPIYDNNGINVSTINIDTLFSKFNIDIKFKRLIYMIIRMHWDFGNILKIYNDIAKKTLDENRHTHAISGMVEEYLNNIYDIIIPADSNIFSTCVSSLLIVSISDNLATQPYGINRITKKNIIPNNLGAPSLNKKSWYFPYITNIPKNYKGLNLSVVSNLYTNGIKLSNKILEYSIEFYKKKINLKV